VEHQGSKGKVGTFRLQRSGGIAKKVSHSRRSKDCMQALRFEDLIHCPMSRELEDWILSVIA
jgi:hypothetical protein